MNTPAGIYIHVPFCAKKCPYCDFYSVGYSAAAVSRYADAVCRNLNVLPADLSADTVYFGGGTPSLLPPAILSRFLDTVRTRISLAADAEITLEVNPLTATDEHLSAWRSTGINRLSFGVQSFSAEILHTLGRRHTPEQAASAVLRAAGAGFDSLTVDLMVGLATQTADALQSDLETACALPVTHISAYLLKIEPNTPFGRQPPALLDADDTADRYLQMHHILTANGFRHYEISNFAKPGAESRHNTKYWQLAPYYGIGPAAHSCFGGKRYAVKPSLEAFCDTPLQQAEITEPHAETTAEQIMLGLRLSAGIDTGMIPEPHRSLLMKRAKPLIPQYLTAESGRLAMTPAGWLVSNAVLAELLRDLPDDA